MREWNGMGLIEMDINSQIEMDRSGEMQEVGMGMRDKDTVYAWLEVMRDRWF